MVVELDPPISAAEMPRDELLGAEKEALGLYVSSHPLNDCRRRVQQTTRGRRGRKNDPLYRARRTLHTGADLLTDVGAFLPAEGSAFELLDGVGHFLHLEEPHAVGRRIVAWLTE